MFFSLCRWSGFLWPSLDNSRGYIVKLAFAALLLLAPSAAMAGEAHTFSAGSGKTVLAFGDSITAGYGISKAEALPAQLQALFESQGHPVTVINAGVSGETTAGGLRRLEWTLKKHNPDYVILALGGNDMLRAIDPRTSLQNLQQMMELLKAYKKPVLLVGMRAPESMGPAFSKGYDLMYAGLARDYGAVFYPFILEGVAANPALNLRDGVHPNAQGVAVIVRGMYPYVVELLKK